MGLDKEEEIQSVSLYKIRPLVLHGYIFPFIFIYIGWLYCWLAYIGYSDHFEAGLIGFAVIGVLQILTCLFCHWFVQVKCILTCSKVQTLDEATVVKVVPTANNGYPDLVRISHTESVETGKMSHWFVFQKLKYTYNADLKRFKSPKFPTDNIIKYYVECRGYQSDQELKLSDENFGHNEMVMDIPKFAELFTERATAPFFVFQVFCVGLWCLDEYWYYSVFTLIMLIIFECTLVQQQLRNMSEIRKMGNKPYTIQTYRNKKWIPVRSDQLVAGDIVSIGRSKDEQFVPCDLLLIRGPCVLDESMLTGESVPVMKEPVETLNESIKLNLETDSKLHVLFGGTKILQHSPPLKSATALKAPDNGCIAYVLQTGFNTSQGRLLKTILFSVKRVTANNLETFLFILFLLIFAIIASGYVWIKGTENPKRNRYKLFLECTLILTSVVPPELPIELSLAVNSSLMALSRLYVYCTEPFRIPFAGKVDICCFDKTGTLTRDEMVVEGVAGLKVNAENNISAVLDCPLETLQVLATCHSLVQMDHDIVGDPLEKAILSAVEWTLTKGEAVMPKGVRTHPLKIFHRYHFTSALQRMSVIAGHTPLGSVDTEYIGCVKGSPEALKPMFVDLPGDYDQVYKEMARRGARVLALGHKYIGKLSHQQVRESKREVIEENLSFCGFVVISCPLKSDTKAAVKEILQSSHHVVMITGDNPLTGCHVSKQIKMTRKEHTLILTQPNSFDKEWHWQSVDDSVTQPLKPRGGLSSLTLNFDLCMTGDGLLHLQETDIAWMRKLMPAVKVYARVSPKQKELVITVLRDMGYGTLMCGDGTNDVGALKHADVGVALLANAPERPSAPPTTTPDTADSGLRNGPPHAPSASGPRGKGGPRGRGGPPGPTQALTPREQNLAATNKKLNAMMAQIEEEEKAQVVHLGDASIAAPFTAKLSSVYGVCHIVKQGRCTLVTTLQMFKILALNALILAYSQSVLYLDGVKFSDVQATLQALLLAGCFLFISRSKPLGVLSKRRPLPNIFNAYTLLTVLTQFAVHFCSLYVIAEEAKARDPVKKDKDGYVDIHSEFEPNLLNSVVYLISIAMQITTFAVNYKGRPFMESVIENRPLLYSLLGAAGAVLALTSGFIPEAADQFKIVPIPDEFRQNIIKVMLMDFVACQVIDNVLDFILGKGKMKRVS